VLIALRSNWWITCRDREPVRFALIKANRTHWKSVVERVLTANKESGQVPSSWSALSALLGINPANLFLWRAGKNARRSPKLSVHDLQGIASVLRIPAGDLFPDLATQVTLAVGMLSRNAVTEMEAQAYVTYALALPNTHWLHASASDQALDAKALHEAAGACGLADDRRVEEIVLKVAAALEPELKKCQQ
jgi:hypothetical protein